jgi:ParB family chromosome partitioning protein
MSTSGSGSGNQRKGGLGRGLGALIPTPVAAPVEGSVAGGPVEVPICQITPNPYQPRQVLDPARLQALAESIRQHGVIQPLVVRKTSDTTYILIAGERRWRASQLAGLETVPVVLKDAAPRAQLELALVENIVRADLSPLEEAAAYRQLIDEFGLTQAEVAERVGRSRVSVTNTLRLLAAPQRLQDALAGGLITEGHARALLGLPTAADQIAMLEAVIARDWTVRQTEDAVRRWVTDQGRDPQPARSPVDPNVVRVEDRLQRALGTRVAVKRDTAGGAGTVTIHFHSEEELHALFDRIVGEELW